MADDLNQRGEPDRSFVSISEDHEVRYWTEKFGVSKAQLQQAVDQVGNNAEAISERFGQTHD